MKILRFFLGFIAIPSFVAGIFYSIAKYGPENTALVLLGLLALLPCTVMGLAFMGEE